MQLNRPFCSLNVRKLVIPAVPEMEKTWTNVFGFKPVESSKKQKFKLVNLLIINGTGLLEKRLLPTGTINGQTTARPANAVGSDKTGAQIFGEASGSVTPVHVSREIDVADDVETRYHENSRPSIGCSAGEENEVKRTLERTSPVSTGDVKSHTLPGVDCGDNMQFKAVTDNIQEGKYKETNGKLIAENTVAEQKCEDISNSSHAHSLATPVTLDPRSLSNGMGKGENRPSNKPLVEAIPITNKTESDLRSNSPSVCANQGDEKSCAAPFDTIIPSVTMDEKPGNHKLQIMVADGYIPISTKVKGLEDITNVVNGTSIGTYRDEDTSEDHSASAVDCGVSMKESVQQTEVTEDKIFSPSADLKPSSIGKDMLERLYESKSIESDKIEMNDTTIKVGMTVESPNNAGITEPRLDISNDVCGEVMAKHTQTCGEGQLHGGDVTCSNSMEDDLASTEPVNA
uniref:Increased DNA methylation 1 C-terminal domain-containing protein n=1 Tax=Arundo donax TaxID=35708 RepID=A0A0A9CGP7_ARUDO